MGSIVEEVMHVRKLQGEYIWQLRYMVHLSGKTQHYL